MMDAQTALFYVFSAVLLLAALRVITARNSVHAALFLVLAFFQAAAIWMLLKAEFLAISLVLVYVGAVMVLFLFVVMMLDVKIDAMRTGFWRHMPLAGLIGAVIALEMAAVLLGGFRVTEADKSPAAMALAQQTANTKELGKVLYTQYLYPVQVAAAILLVAIIAAIALTLRRRKDSRSQNASQQVRVKAKDRMVVVKMSATVEQAAAPAVEPTAAATATGAKA
jgi:NADH-quinone oxidoreductase subunit J